MITEIAITDCNTTAYIVFSDRPAKSLYHSEGKVDELVHEFFIAPVLRMKRAEEIMNEDTNIIELQLSFKEAA